MRFADMITDLLNDNPCSQFAWSGKAALQIVERFGLLKEAAEPTTGSAPLVQCDVCSTHQTHWILGMRVSGMEAMNDNGFFVRCLPRSDWPEADMRIFVNASLAAFGLQGMVQPRLPTSILDKSEGILDYLAARTQCEYTLLDDQHARQALSDLSMQFPAVCTDWSQTPAHRVCYCLGQDHPTHWIVAAQYSGMLDVMNDGHVMKFLPRALWSEKRLMAEISRLLHIMSCGAKPLPM